MNTPNFDEWTTEKLGEMIQLTRHRAQEAQARFEASKQEDRRKRKQRTFETEQTEAHARRVEDDLELLRAELRRRALDCCTDVLDYQRPQVA